MLLLGLLLLLWAWRSGALMSSSFPRPITCSMNQPEWLGHLVELAEDLEWPGFQVSYIDARGVRGDCAVGWAGPLQPMRLDHVMRYASLSKLFTSLVMAQLYAEKRLSPNDRLIDRLGEAGSVRFVDSRVAQITLDQLLRHTAGFGRTFGLDSMLSADPWCPRHLERLRFVRLDHSPGSRYVYSNLGYCLLGAVISKAEGSALDDVYRRRLLVGHSLSSVVSVSRGVILSGEPARYYAPSESEENLLDLSYESLLAVGAWAGTARDLLSLLERQFSGESLSLLGGSSCDASIWRGCHGPGLYAYRQPGSQFMHWRDGSLPGVSAFAGIFSDGAKVVVLANGRRVDWMQDSDRLGQALYQWMH